MTDAGGWLWRRLKRWASQLAARSRSEAGGLSIRARLDLGGKKSLLVVAYGERRFLLASGPETLSAPIEIGVGREAARAGGKGCPAPLAGNPVRAGERRLRRLRGAGDSAARWVERVGQ
jgi:hypothetical protein